MQGPISWDDNDASCLMFKQWFSIVIDWLRSLASIMAVAEQLRLSWDEVDGILARAVERALARRRRIRVKRIGVDETSFQRRHGYVTIVTDLDGSRVLHVADDRKREPS